MKMNKKEKSYDAVKIMRDIRDKISTEAQSMSYEEFKAYIEKSLKKASAIPSI